jgi:energy-coupling factor transport system permease protein
VLLPFYRARDSALHDLHPAAKVVLALGVLVVSLVLSHPLYLLAVLLGTVALAASARVLRDWWGFMRLFAMLAATVVAINALANSRGATVLWAGPFLPVFGQLSITLESIAFGAVMALRLFAAVSAFTVLSLTLPPDELTQLLSGFAYRSGLALSLATRLYPVVVRDAGSIMDAQRSRGLDLDSGGRMRRIRARLPVVVPLFHESLERAVGIGEAMEARGFGSGARTRWRAHSLRRVDLGAMAAAVTLCAFSVALSLVGGGAPSYYPHIVMPLGPLVLSSSVLLAVLVALPAAGAPRGAARGGDGDG